MAKFLSFFVVLLLLTSSGQGKSSGWWISGPISDWTFTRATPAFSPDDPSQQLGEFQVGIRVEVVEPVVESGHWLVRFPRPGMEPLEALIAIPRIPEERPALERQAASQLSEFPLLKALLEEDARLFQGDLLPFFRAFHQGEGQARVTAGTSSNPEVIQLFEGLNVDRWQVFGQTPITIQFQPTRQGNHRITIDLWNKGYDYLRPNFRENAVRGQVRRQLTELTHVFADFAGGRERARRGEISMIRDGGERFLLPNFIEVTFRHIPGEYMLIEIQSLLPVEQTGEAIPREREALLAYLAAQVQTRDSSGHRYIAGIPMIDQGSRGYCVVATMARVLNFYGYDVEINSLANLAGTLPQSSFAATGGTFLPDAIRAMRQSGYGTPFRLAEISATGNRAEGQIREAIDAGTPILWLIPGHMNLIIGYHSGEDGIVYSDSWGPGHEFKTMSWSEFHRFNRGMFVLRP